jgi:hypothetical protein
MNKLHNPATIHIAKHTINFITIFFVHNGDVILRTKVLQTILNLYIFLKCYSLEILKIEEKNYINVPLKIKNVAKILFIY